MTRPVCCRAMALFPLALLGLTGNAAMAEQSEPATPGRQADQQTTTPAQTPAGVPQPQPPATGAAGQPSSQGLKQQPGTPVAPQGPTPTIQTPAEQKYGLPRNPLIGQPVDIDLTKPLSIERAVQIGLQRQNQIAIAVTQRDQNSALLTQARAAYFPHVTPTLVYNNSKAPTYEPTFFPNGLPSGRAIHSVVTDYRTDGIVASQTIWDTGIREANVGFNRRSLFAAEYNIGNVRQDVILNVTQDYYSLLRDKELVQVEDENVKRAQTTLDSILAQLAVGNAAQSDTLQAQSDLANAKVSLLQAQNNAFVDEVNLKNAMGVVTSQPLILATTTVPPPNTTPDPRSEEDYVRLAYIYRLGLKQQQETIWAQGYQVKIANINNGVTVQASVNEGYQLDPNAGEERTFVVSFSYPLFDAGQTRAVVKQNKALLEEQRRTLDQLQQNTRQAVEQDYLTREVSRQQVVAAQAAVDAGQTNYNAALEKQRNGLVNILDVINAEVQLVTARVQQVEAVYNFYIADVRLQRDIGQNDPLYIPNVPAERNARLRRNAASPTTLAAPAPKQPVAATAGATGAAGMAAATGATGGSNQDIHKP
jgi:outer membrane protein TolC